MENQAGLLDYVIGVAVLVVLIALFIWFVVRAVRRSDDPGKLITRMVASLVVVPILLLGFKSHNPLFLFLCFLLSGAIMACFWTSYITAAIARPFSNLYSGGDLSAEPAPFYSVAEGKRNTGRYLEAIAGIRGELAKFPNDFKGQMMLADIQAENLRDVEAAQETLQAMLAQPGHERKNIAYALNRLADWHLKIDKNPEAAKEAVQWIIQMYPGTEAAYQATQRLAHMDNPVSAPSQPQRFVVKQQTEHLGLREDFSSLKAPAEDFEVTAATLLKRLEAQPSDNEAREQLAILYARQFNRLDMAAELIEQMLAQEGAPVSHRVHWLNLLADLQITVALDSTAARKTLQRIIDIAPGSVDAGKASQRMLFVDRDVRNQKAGTTFHVGEYEQNIGLKNPKYPTTPKSHDGTPETM